MSRDQLLPLRRISAGRRWQLGPYAVCVKRRKSGGWLVVALNTAPEPNQPDAHTWLEQAGDLSRTRFATRREAVRATQAHILSSGAPLPMAAPPLKRIEAGVYTYPEHPEFRICRDPEADVSNKWIVTQTVDGKPEQLHFTKVITLHDASWLLMMHIAFS